VLTADRQRELADYYGTVAPFYGAEAAIRDDLRHWRRLVAQAAARTVLDLGCGDGRLARALGSSAQAVGLDILTALLPPSRDFAFVQGDMRALPFADRSFDLAIAANDPFAHLLSDDERTRAVSEASRVAERVVIDGLCLTPTDQERARHGGLVRTARLADGTERRETWAGLGDDRYRATYRYIRDAVPLAEATCTVRAWSSTEAALRGRAVHLAGGLDGRPYRADAAGFVLVIGGPLWS
jgi:SAM-dependent methyltransferase